MKGRPIWIQAEIIRTRQQQVGTFVDYIPVYKFRPLRYMYYLSEKLYFKDIRNNSVVVLHETMFGKQVKKHAMYPGVLYADL